MEPEQQAIEILRYLVTEYRRAFNHGGDYESIERTRQTYCLSIQEKWKLSEDDLHIIYLKAKILADEYQLDRHKTELAKLEDKQYNELGVTAEQAANNFYEAIKNYKKDKGVEL